MYSMALLDIPNGQDGVYAQDLYYTTRKQKGSYKKYIIHYEKMQATGESDLRREIFRRGWKGGKLD